jgi:hypothetical protein
MSKRLELATEVMGPHAGLHPDQTGRHIGEARFNLATRPLLSQHNGAPPILANDVERILPDIDADYGDRALQCLCHGVLLVFGVPASLIAGGAGARPDHPINGRCALDSATTGFHLATGRAIRRETRPRCENWRPASKRYA